VVSPSTPAAGFTCSYPLNRPSSKSGTTFIRDVRVGSHAGYDRIVFEFLGAGIPDLRVRRVAPPFVADPSGLTLTVPGTSFIQIRMTQTTGAGYARPDGQPTYTGPSSFQPGYPRLVSLVQAGDFEGVSTWIAGLTGRMCYRVSVLKGPARLVIDLRAP